MPDYLNGMVDAMLLESTTPEQVAEIGRMATEGAFPADPDEDPTPGNPEAAAWAKDFVLSSILSNMQPPAQEEQPGPITEEEPHPTPEPAPIRHSRKPSLTAPLTIDEIKAAGEPAKLNPIVIHNHLPPTQESPAMVKLAESLGKTLEKIADNASKPAKPAQVNIAKGAIQVTTPPVTIAKGAVTVQASKPAAVKIDNHVHVPKVKEIKRDKDGNMIRPIYEE